MNIDEIKKHIEKVPRYSYLGESLKKSYYRYYKFRFANWIMEGKLMGTVTWYNELLTLIKEMEWLEDNPQRRE